MRKDFLQELGVPVPLGEVLQEEIRKERFAVSGRLFGDQPRDQTNNVISVPLSLPQINQGRRDSIIYKRYLNHRDVRSTSARPQGY